MKLPTLRRRLLAAMFVSSISSLLLACGTLLIYELFATKRSMMHNLSTLAEAVAANSTALLAFDDQSRAREILSALRSEPDVVNACLYDKSGHLFSSTPAGSQPGLFPNVPGRDGLQFSGFYLTVFQPVVQGDGRLGTLFIREDLHGMFARFGFYGGVVFLIMIGSAGVAMLVSGYFQRRISEPILDLAAVARRISDKGDFSVRARHYFTAEELEVLTTAFNDMLDQIHGRDLSLERARQDLQSHAEMLESRVADRTRSLEETTRQLYDFCYSIAHDLKAPIRSQAGFARILINDFAEQLGPEATGYAQRIADAADRQSRLVTDLLAHVSLDRHEMPLEKADLAQIAEQVRTDLRVEIERRKATLDFSGVHGYVLANPSSLNLVILNLVSNALKFVPRERMPQVKVWTEKRNGRLRLWVEDNGIGIATKHFDKLFTMFQRLHTRDEYAGTGIGLAIVKRAAERMSGKVGVESEVGKGSRFWVEFAEFEEKP